MSRNEDHVMGLLSKKYFEKALSIDIFGAIFLTL